MCCVCSTSPPFEAFFFPHHGEVEMLDFLKSVCLSLLRQLRHDCQFGGIVEGASASGGALSSCFYNHLHLNPTLFLVNQ